MTIKHITRLHQMSWGRGSINLRPAENPWSRSCLLHISLSGQQPGLDPACYISLYADSNSGSPSYLTEETFATGRGRAQPPPHNISTSEEAGSTTLVLTAFPQGWWAGRKRWTTLGDVGETQMPSAKTPMGVSRGG